MATPTQTQKTNVLLGPPIKFANPAPGYCGATLDFYETATTGEIQLENVFKGSWKTSLDITRLGNIVYVTFNNGTADVIIKNTKPAFREGSILHRFAPKKQRRCAFPGGCYGSNIIAVINNDGSIQFEDCYGDNLGEQELERLVGLLGTTITYQL